VRKDKVPIDIIVIIDVVHRVLLKMMPMDFPFPLFNTKEITNIKVQKGSGIIFSKLLMMFNEVFLLNI